MMLPDGSIVPHFMSAQASAGPEPSDAFTQLYLRNGEVTDVIYPSDPRSSSRRVIEYAVAAQYHDHARGTTTVKIYPNCFLSAGHGTAADHSHTVLSADPNAINAAGTPGFGSKVLLLCVGGGREQAAIVGFLSDGADLSQQKLSSADGRQHLWVFNGVSVFVDKDGQPSITYRGATDPTGATKVSDDAAGSSARIDKDGSVRALAGDQKVELDKTAQAVNVSAGQTVNVKAGSEITLDAPEGVMTGAATDFTMKGATFRAAQATLNATLAATIGAAAAAIGSACNPALGAVQPVQAALLPAAAALAAAAAALAAFEAGALGYLSLKNRSD